MTLHVSRRALPGLLGYSAAGLAGLIVLGPGELENIVRSPEALVRFSLLGLLWLLIGYVGLPRLVRAPRLRMAVRGVVVAVALAAALAPSFQTKTVNEDLPGLSAAAANTPSPTAALPTPTTPAPTTSAPTTPAPTTPAPTTSAPPTGTTGPVRLGEGPLRGINHRGAGTASLVRLATGAVVVRLEGLDVEGAPDVVVQLIPGADRERPTGDGETLGKLKGNRGNQNYPVPAGFAVKRGDWTVLLWCRAFAVPIANATVPVG